MDATARAIAEGQAVIGIELGSTNIKTVLIGPRLEPLASGSHQWENQFVDRTWTYALDDVWDGLRDAYAKLADDVRARHGVELTAVAGLGISAMMHGYLAFDADDQLLAPFRTWRNTMTGPAAARLTRALGHNIPQRWSAAHLYQAVLNGEPHVADVRYLTTLAGYVHWRLTGQKVIGIGDASGMFPIDTAAKDFDAAMLEKFDALVAEAGLDAPWRLGGILPKVLVAGRPAGVLTPEGAALLDPAGRLLPGAPLCPPEGDAGTGMTATNSVRRRTGNVSAGTSVFAMVVLERPLAEVHEEIDIVTTPAGDAVAMVHCNNGASELDQWCGLFGEFAAALGAPAEAPVVFETLFRRSLDAAGDCGGLLAYNYLAGETITSLDEGRPLTLRTPDSDFTLANFMRAQVFGVFATLALGMRILDVEGVEVDAMFAHGGLFKTKGVAQRYLAAALNTPVTVGEIAGQGGAWGIALLAAFASDGGGDLDAWLSERVFAQAALETVAPDPADVAGFASYLTRYEAGLAVERAAVGAI
ncbi:MAG: ATPase [Propionibacteriaceae bacterium]|jgi:sugar (pentulose or hexulose) kinase|nr:ATPase [Propionibacteriaceae bacterium]